MPQTKVTNHTVGTHQILFTQDESLKPIVAPIVKVTFDISALGELRFSPKQIPINMEGEYYGEPENSSYLYEPEVAFIKPLTDVVIIADACSPRGPIDRLPVSLRLGTVEKNFLVTGNRSWMEQRLSYVPSAPEPFETIPLTYENAFGGWDTRHPDTALHGFEARNTVGKGFFNSKGGKLTQPLFLPNVEHSNTLISDIEHTPEPASCGFTLPHWQPRAQFAGTFNSEWEKTKSPLLPNDFNRQFYNAASQGLIFNENEIAHMPVSFTHVTPTGELAFNLPKIRPPVCEIALKTHVEHVHLKLDTVIINLRKMQMCYLWRNYLPLNRGPHDCQSIEIHNG